MDSIRLVANAPAKERTDTAEEGRRTQVMLVMEICTELDRQSNKIISNGEVKEERKIQSTSPYAGGERLFCAAEETIPYRDAMQSLIRGTCVAMTSFLFWDSIRATVLLLAAIMECKKSCSRFNTG